MTWVRQARLVGCLLVALWGCTVSPPPIPIHDEPSLLVEVAYDPHAGTGHSHPGAVSADQVITILKGLQLQGRDVAGAFGLLGDDSRTPAFVDRDAAALAPHLAAGLSKASPRDLVTFHLVQRDSQRAPLITSGGMFLRNRHLYIILANARTSPSSVQYETTYEPNSRLSPLLPIARFKFKTEFRPAGWRIETAEAKRMDGWEGYLDESKVVVVDLGRTSNSTTGSPVSASQLSRE